MMAEFMWSMAPILVLVGVGVLIATQPDDSGWFEYLYRRLKR